MGLGQIYTPSSCEKVIEMERELEAELLELKTELEGNDILYGIAPKIIGTVPMPKDLAHFRRERALVILRAQQVCEAQPLHIQAEEMRQEMEAAESREYTPKSLPLLLQQYFLDRIQNLVRSKHMHMLRWCRFCEHTSTIENLYSHYSQRLDLLMSEYNDCVQRARRLSAARESYLADNPDYILNHVTLEDLLIYLRWLVCHLHSMRHFNQYLRFLQWLPITHKQEIAVPTEIASELEESNALKMASRYQDESSYSQVSASLEISLDGDIPTPVPRPPPINLAMLTTAPLPSSAVIYAAAATGGGLASDEDTCFMPLSSCDREIVQPHLNFLLNIYGINIDLSTIQDTAGEMEMFFYVSLKFKQIFTKQEILFTFRTYDRIDSNLDSENSQSAMLKEANWLPFITLKPLYDQVQVKRWTQLHQANRVDDLLRIASLFLQVKDVDKAQDSLKDHAALVNRGAAAYEASIASRQTAPSSLKTLWKNIYTNPNLYTKEEPDEDLSDTEGINLLAHKSASQCRKESYNYMNTIHMLGLDAGEHTTDVTTMHGSYISFLHLRHLRIRDLRRTCLGFLNYFRSVERTLTINDSGLSFEKDSVKRSSQSHRQAANFDGTVTGSGLGSHAYVHNTPVDFKISEHEFMEFSSVENHDDFYSVEEGRITVLDQRGCNIMYDAAVNDLKVLEKDLLLMASHYIEKDREHRISMLKESDNGSKKTNAGDFDIRSYAHGDADRFGILMDIWTNEAYFLQCKRQLLDCYFEAYQHVTDSDESRALAQEIVNVIYRRPRFDFEAKYFIHLYRIECSILQQETQLLKTILDRQIEDQREYTQRVCREEEVQFGLPLNVIPKQPVAINFSRPALRNVYMLEFHPSLSIASRVPAALRYANLELQQMHYPESVLNTLLLEKQLLEVAQKEWDSLPSMGGSFGSQLEKDLFSDVFIEDPLFVCELAQHLVAQSVQDNQTARPTQRERQLSLLNLVGRVMETVTLRHRLLDAAWESEILSKIYLRQAKDMGYDSPHLYVRMIQFEYSGHRSAASKPPPVFITAIQDNDSVVDKFNPSHRLLAIHELDETHVGRFSFRTRDGVLQILRPGGMESFQAVLKTQIVHKQALISAVLQASICHPIKPQSIWNKTTPAQGRSSPTETKSEKSTITSASTGTGPASMGGTLVSTVTASVKSVPESFMSLQLEKNQSRDRMLNAFVEKKIQMGNLLKNHEELEKLKRNCISQFCDNFCVRLSHTSMRAQILAYYNSILTLLQDFPSLRDTYFMFGEPNEKKSEEVEDAKPDPRSYQPRPRRFFSQDGKQVINIWFVPHHTEILIMFKHLDDDVCYRGLAYCLSIVSSLHDILQYLCAFCRLGASRARLGSQRIEFVCADWGGTEGIGVELREIQKQVDALPDPQDPDKVQELLWLRRDVMFLEFNIAVKPCMVDTFLSTGNTQDFQVLNSQINQALSSLSNVQRPSLFSSCLPVPEPLEPTDSQAQNLFPWRSFIGRHGPFPCMFWQWSQIASNVQLCLAGLKDAERQVANGEILGVTLLMEDVLHMGYRNSSSIPDAADHILEATKDTISLHGSIVCALLIIC